MSLLDSIFKSMPYSNILNAPDQNEINSKFKVFSDASVTKDEKVQRLSIVNKFDENLENSTQAGFWVNSLSELIFSSDSNDKTRRIEGYRQMAGFPEVTDCLREICDEFIVKDENGKILQFALRGEHNEEIKEDIKNEFYKFLEIFALESKGWDYMKDFLIEGEIYFENIVSIQKPELGIVGLTKIGTDRVDPFYSDIDNELIQLYVLKKKMLDNQGRARQYTNASAKSLEKKNQILFLNEKQITYIHSGSWDDSGKKKYRKPHLENGSRPYRQLALIEDATIIYMLVRAPERLVFNIDTGHLPPGQSDAYVKKQMSEFWNRKGIGKDQRIDNVYDPMTMLENFYFAKPRGSDGSSVTSISGGKSAPDNLEILTLFINRLYKSMGVPLQRLNAESGFSDGMDITREELRFAKFIIRLQQRFAMAIKSTFITHLKLKGRKLTEQAVAVNVMSIPEGKEWFDLIDWDNYDVLSETVSNKNKDRISMIKESQKYCVEKLNNYKRELTNLDSLLMESANRDDRKQTIIEQYGRVVAEIETYNAEIKQIKQDEYSLWTQYGLREEDIDLEFNKPSQYFALREQQMWQLKFESYQSLAGDDLISNTLAQKTFLGWSDSEIMQNREAVRKDAALRWELANIESEGPDFREKLAAAAADMMGGGEMGLGDALGGDMMGGDDTSLPDFGDAPTDADLGISDDAPAEDMVDGPNEEDIPPPPSK